MGNNYLSIREMALYKGNQPGGSISFRQIIGIGEGNLCLQAKDFPFSILAYNTALITISYKGSDRSGTISELVKRIKAETTDVACLCEVFDDDEREMIRSQLSFLYPYYREGPDEADLDEDGGLLILSKYPILKHYQSIFRQCAGNDCWANKGVIHVRVHPFGSPTPCDIFFSHTQNIEETGGKDALYAQLTHLDHMVRSHADPHIPTIIMGDLNIPAEVKVHYNQLIKKLGRPVDLWLTKNPSMSGFTYTTDNNFYDDPDNAPNQNHRLDYILLKAGLRFVPILKDIEILKWTHTGRQISDHFGLLARFEQLMEAGIDISGAISKVTAVITGFRCIETTSGPGSDEVSFSIGILDQQGRFVKMGTPVIKNVDRGEYHRVKNIRPATLRGDPGDHLTIELQGTEHDAISNNSLGIISINISRTDLLLNKGRNFNRVMPYLTGDGGEYGVEIRVSVA